MHTLVKIQFNKKFNFFEALTATANNKGEKLHKFGNDFNINAVTEKEVKILVLKSELIENPIFTNNK